jgi:chorismate mutase
MCQKEAEMMELLEANPLPMECQNCNEEDCYNCDNAGKRWYLPKEEELRIRRKGMIHSIERLQKKVEDIDRELYWIELERLYCGHDVGKFREHLRSRPEFFRERLAKIDAELDDPNSELRKQHDAWWAELKPKLVEEFGEEWVAKNCKD